VQFFSWSWLVRRKAGSYLCKIFHPTEIIKRCQKGNEFLIWGLWEKCQPNFRASWATLKSEIWRLFNWWDLR